jgi:hypothetical protein
MPAIADGHELAVSAGLALLDFALAARGFNVGGKSGRDLVAKGVLPSNVCCPLCSAGC